MHDSGWAEKAQYLPTEVGGRELVEDGPQARGVGRHSVVQPVLHENGDRSELVSKLRFILETGKPRVNEDATLPGETVRAEHTAAVRLIAVRFHPNPL